MLSKNRPRVRDSDYFRRLNENFSRLQDGTQLTPSDRYWAWYESRDSNFAGSPIVNHTVGLLKDERFKDLFEEYMKVKNMERRDNRKELANMVGFVSGAWKGGSYSNSKYFTHVPIIQDPITEHDKARIEYLLFSIQKIIKNAMAKKCKYSGEQIGAMFKTTQKFTGSMMIDLTSVESKSDEEKDDVSKCWMTFIGEYRKHKEVYAEKKWLNDVYEKLSDGHKRNCNKEDFEERLGAVKTWWSKYEG